MKPEELRIALFSGNYNYVRDGANQALNRLVGFLLRQGANVRVYSPTTDTPAFPPTGDLVSVPSVPIPGRSEYRLAYSLPAKVQRDLAAFNPNLVHVAAPDIVAHRAVTWGRKRDIPVVSSVHTRFDTYLQYYHLQFLEPVVRAVTRRYYRRCDAILGAGGIHRGDPARPADEQGYFDLGARCRPGPVQSGAAQHGWAPLPRNRRRGHGRLLPRPAGP